jgi:hypothetical protein
MIRLRVYENRVLKGIFRPKRKEARGDCKRREALLYNSPNATCEIKSRRDRRGVQHVWGKEEVIQGFVGEN